MTATTSDASMQAPAATGDTPSVLPKWREACYGSPYLFKAMLFTPVLAFIPSFYSVDHGIPLATLGTILLITRLTDVLTDPLLGILSDRTRSRWGRRKPFIFVSAPLLMFTAWMVLVPPVEVTITYAVIWLSLLYLAFTIFDIPYRAWGAELVEGYHGRTRLAGWREGFGMASGLTVMSLIVLAPTLGLGSTSDTLMMLAALFVIGTPIVTFLTLRFVPEPEIRAPAHEAHGAAQEFKIMLSNKPFLWLLGGVIILLSGAIIGASLHMIVMESYFGIRAWFPYILAGEGLAGVLSAPLWVMLSRRIGKHRAMSLATFLMGAFSAIIPFLGPDDDLLYAAVIVTRGFAGGGLGILIASMLADVIDVDRLNSGQSRGGLLFALVGMIGKLGVAFGSFVGLVIPPLFGFDPASKSNSPEALNALLMTYAFIPMLIMGSASFFFWRYPLTKAAHAKVQAALKERT
jgi:Na+/melibiose symporter-like transporter